jgi:hypothetical protein
MSYIRKISIGADYKNAMHYIVGQYVLGGNYVIEEIVEYDDSFGVMVKSDGIILEWKRFKNVPAVIEYNIDMI